MFFTITLKSKTKSPEPRAGCPERNYQKLKLNINLQFKKHLQG